MKQIHANFLVNPTDQSHRPHGPAVTFLYADKGQRVGATNADGTTLSYSYDANGNMLTATDKVIISNFYCLMVPSSLGGKGRKKWLRRQDVSLLQLRGH